MIALVNTPNPEPSVVWLPAIVGFKVVAQQTPRAVTVAPPMPDTFPPDEAVVVVIEVGVVVLITGSEARVVNCRSLP